MIKLIEKIEGEAELDFKFDGEVIDFVEIRFLDSRGIENILKGKSALDALVINPRVCGICGHAHLLATVKALEDCYEYLQVPKNALIVRELTQNFEIIQNHFKWFYMTIMPLFGYKDTLLKAVKPSNIMAKAIATIGGQYPHTSYAIPGGVTCELNPMDIVKVKNYIKQTIEFFEQNVVIAKSSEILECDNSAKLLKRDGDLPLILNTILNNGWKSFGKSYDKFIVFGENSYFKSGKSIATRLNTNLDISKVLETENSNTKAKNVTYKGKYFEVGPFSRAMMNKTALIKDAHFRYKDSIFSRILARVCETLQLLNYSLELLEKIDFNAPFYIEPKVDISKVSGKGIGMVEAARGSLIHEVTLKNGIIEEYKIITPTQWNLSNGTKENSGVAQKAMIGLNDTKIAEIVFKAFDVCSVCTTH